MKHLLAAALTAFSLALTTGAALAATRIDKLDTGIANVYLLRGEGPGAKPVMVDASSHGHEAEIEAWLRSLGVEPKDLGLIVLTHGHGDHAGGADHFIRQYETPVMAGEGDLAQIHYGQMAELNPTSLLAGLLRVFIGGDMKYAPFVVTTVVSEEVSLRGYGIEGRVVPQFWGHTPGSLAVVLDDSHEALVGDLVRGSITEPGVAEEHFFHFDRNQSRWQLYEMITKQGVKVLHPGHFGSFTSDEVWVTFFPEGKFAWPSITR